MFMKTKASITFGFVDVTAKNDSSLSVNDKQIFVDLEDLRSDDIEEIKYGTCEKNQFALDGTFELMPDYEDLDDMCWWSNEMSNENGQFATPLIMEINFTEPHSSLGLTIIGSSANDYCNDLNIKFYDANDDLISEGNFNPDRYDYICNNICENYSKIVITFYSTNNPYRYLKIYKILYGAIKVFEGDNLMKANVLEEVDLLSSEVSINTLDFTIYSANDEFNIINPKGFYSLLQQRQKFQVKETLIKKNQEKFLGTYYLDKWSNEKDKTMKIEAIDLIGVIDKTDFIGGMYTNILFEDLIEEIMTSANLESDEYEIEQVLTNIELTGYIPICTHREALQQVLFAVGAVADCSRSEKIKIYTVKDLETENEIDKGNIFQGTKKIEQNENVTGVEVVVHQFTPDETKSEKLYEGTLNVGQTRILFNEPVYSMSCTGGTIAESNCNYAIVECTQESQVLITGYKYKDNLQSHLVEIPNLIPSQKQNTLKIEKAYFVNKNNAETIGERILNYYQKTYKTSFDFLIEDEVLADNVIIEGDFDQQLKGNITKLEIDLTGGFIASTEVQSKIKEDEENG